MQILFPFSPNFFYRNIDESQANLFNAVGESWRVSKVTDHIIMSNYYEQQLQKLKLKLSTLWKGINESFIA